MALKLSNWKLYSDPRSDRARVRVVAARYRWGT